MSSWKATIGFCHFEFFFYFIFETFLYKSFDKALVNCKHVTWWHIKHILRRSCKTLIGDNKSNGFDNVLLFSISEHPRNGAAFQKKNLLVEWDFSVLPGHRFRFETMFSERL